MLTSKGIDQHVLKIPLKECDESLVKVGEKWALRKSVAKALVKAASEFQKKGYKLLIKDAHRSLSIQRRKFLKYLAKIQKSNPGMSLEKAKETANTFIAGIPILAAHTCGAAVDVVLLDKNNKVVDMGCDYLTLGEEAITDNPNLTKPQAVNRQLLKKVMEDNGFTNYPFEYWHYSLGDAFAAYLNHQKYAIYGPVGNINQMAIYEFFKI